MRPHLIDSGSAIWTAPDRYELMPGSRRLESWERSWAALLGLGAAVDYALDLGLDAIAARVGPMAESFRTRLGDIDGVTVRDLGRRRCGIVTFTVDGRGAVEVRDALAAESVHVWFTSAVAAQFDLPARGLDDMVRASLHYTTTEDELDRVVELVAAQAGA
jgi:selenocysteine lyase/cysteine desulfurase